jgi:hypothetical protein
VFSLFCLFENAADDSRVLRDLEIEHTDGNEVGAVLEGVFEAVGRVYGAGGQRLEGNPGFFLGLEKVDGFLRLKAKHIVVKLIVVFGLLAVNAERLALLFGMRRPVFVVVERFYPVVGLDFNLPALLQDINRMAADARGQAFLFYVVNRLFDNVDSAVFDAIVAGGAVQVYRFSAFIDGLVDTGKGVFLLRRNVDYGLNFAAGVLFVFVDDV